MPNTPTTGACEAPHESAINNTVKVTDRLDLALLHEVPQPVAPNQQPKRTRALHLNGLAFVANADAGRGRNDHRLGMDELLEVGVAKPTGRIERLDEVTWKRETLRVGIASDQSAGK